MAYSIPKAKRGNDTHNNHNMALFIDIKTKENNDEVGPGAYNPRNVGKKVEPQWG